MLIIKIATGIFLVLLIVGFYAKNHTLHSHWGQLLDGMKFSTEEFYTRVETELKDQNIKGVTFEKVALSEGGVMSAQRLYLRVHWKDYTYDMCFAPFGKGIFVSWWLYYTPRGMEEVLGKIPFIGKYLKKAFYPITYYKIDTASSFMTYAQSGVLKVIDSLVKDQGLRSIPDAQRVPIMRDIFDRK